MATPNLICNETCETNKESTMDIHIYPRSFLQHFILIPHVERPSIFRFDIRLGWKRLAEHFQCLALKVAEDAVHIDEHMQGVLLVPRHPAPDLKRSTLESQSLRKAVFQK